MQQLNKEKIEEFKEAMIVYYRRRHLSAAPIHS